MIPVQKFVAKDSELLTKSSVTMETNLITMAVAKIVKLRMDINAKEAVLTLLISVLTVVL